MSRTNRPAAGDVSARATQLAGPKRWRGWWFVPAVLLLAMPFVLSGPADAEQEEIQTRRERIENMSAAERERLERNYARFENLPPDRQAALRKLDDAVKGDDNLNRTLLEYERWLTTLSPWQRAELRNAHTRREKIQVVQTIVTEQRQRAEEYRQEEREYQEFVKENLANLENFPGKKPEARIDDEELGEMLSILESHVPPGANLRQSLASGGVAYQMQVLAAVLEDNLQKNEDAREQPLPPALVEEMIAQLSDSRDREQIQKMYEKSGTRGFVWYLAGKLNGAWWNEARKQYPSRAELDQFAETLGGDDLEAFERKKRDNPRRAYFHLFMAMSRASFQSDTGELNAVLNKLGIRTRTLRPGGGPNPGRHGRGFGGDRDRRGGERGRRDNDFSDKRGQRGRRDRGFAENRNGEEEASSPASAEKPSRQDDQQ